MAKVAKSAAGRAERTATPKPKSQEDVNKIIAEGVQPHLIQAPTFYVSSIVLHADPNNVSLLFSKHVPVEIPLGNNEKIPAGTQMPVVILDMSLGTAKDLSLLINDQLEKIESEWGPIVTPFTQRRAEGLSAAKSRKRRSN
jgi:hypothetical protein